MRNLLEASTVFVRRFLRLGFGSKIIILDASGTETEIDLNELAAIDSIGAADLAKIDGITNGTVAAEKAIVVDAANQLTWAVSSASTDGGTSVESLALTTTMTGIGGVGGRAKFAMTTNVALAGWSNALKADVTYGSSGKTTGLGSAFVAEMTLSAGTTDGNYAPLELELNLGSGAQTGTAAALIYASVNGADASTFDTNGYLMTLAGVTAGTSKMLMNVGTTTALADFTKGLRIKAAGVDYVIPLITAAEFAS
jgi:hypothetical protein